MVNYPQNDLNVRKQLYSYGKKEKLAVLLHLVPGVCL
jgi:hypothetical protein